MPKPKVTKADKETPKGKGKVKRTPVSEFGEDPEEVVEPKPKPEYRPPRRSASPAIEREPASLPQSVSAGAVDKALDLAFNPSREKLREVTIIDWMQGRLFPLLDVINTGRQYCLEVAAYRQNPAGYREWCNRQPGRAGQTVPIQPNLLDELMYRTAQWQKSVKGTNLTKITDIALAEVETRSGDEGDDFAGADAWGKE